MNQVSTSLGLQWVHLDQRKPTALQREPLPKGVPLMEGWTLEIEGLTIWSEKSNRFIPSWRGILVHSESKFTVSFLAPESHRSRTYQAHYLTPCCQVSFQPKLKALGEPCQPCSEEARSLPRITATIFNPKTKIGSASSDARTEVFTSWAMHLVEDPLQASLLGYDLEKAARTYLPYGWNVAFKQKWVW